MVEQMVTSNLSKYGLGNCASIVSSSSDKQPVKETIVREVQNNNKPAPFEKATMQSNNKPAPFEKATLQNNNKPASFEKATLQNNNKPAPFEKATLQNNTKPAPFEKATLQNNTKPAPFEKATLQNNTKPAPFEKATLQKEEAVTQAKSPPGGGNVNRNLVYARRKSDAELSNARTGMGTGTGTGTSDKNRASGYQQAEQVGEKKHIPQTEAKIKGNDGIPMNSVAARIRNCGNEQAAIVNAPAMEHWNARFVQLQKYLKQCDSSNQEVYLQKLRSFSTDECSRRAVELERRAIQLMLEEGREVQRVKDLNVLGPSGGNHPLLRPVTPVFKSEKMV